MKNLIIVLIIITIFTNISAQSWQIVVSNNPNIHFLNDFHFTNPVIGYCVGDSGTVIKTIDSGNTWQSLSANTFNDLYSVKFLNSDTGWIAGRNGTIKKTTDGGMSWINQSFNSKDQRSVYFINKDTGFVIAFSPYATHFNYLGSDSTIMETTDGGNTWFQNYSYNQGIGSIYFNQAGTGFAGSNDTIMISTDKGANWSKIGVHYTGPIIAFNFPSSNVGYALSLNSLLKTTDGGVSWFNATYNVTCGSDGWPESIYFTSNDTGYHVGICYYATPAFGFTGSNISKTSDGGNTETSFGGSADWLTSVFFTNSVTGFAIGGNYYGISNGYGTTWYYGNGIILKYNNNPLNINSDQVKQDELKIYPNPSDKYINICFPENTNYISIIDFLGRVKEKKNVTGLTNSKIEIDESGIYFIQAVTGNKIITKKLVIQR
jgi:photosystem II stability/assembly factor-like uncharacterized protein